MSIPFQIIIEQDQLIRGDLFPSTNKSRGTLVICHGYKGFKDWGMFPYIAKELSEHLDVVTFNFSHNGIGENLLEPVQ